MNAQRFIFDLSDRANTAASPQPLLQQLLQLCTTHESTHDTTKSAKYA
jgi:hypothetical protein